MIERETYEFKVPSGRTICLREITGEDEMAAAAEALSEEGPRGRILFAHACVMRAIVSVDGKPFDQASVTAATVRNQFRAKDWRVIQTQYDAIHEPTQEEMRSFRSSVRFAG